MITIKVTDADSSVTLCGKYESVRRIVDADVRTELQRFVANCVDSIACGDETVESLIERCELILQNGCESLEEINALLRACKIQLHFEEIA